MAAFLAECCMTWFILAQCFSTLLELILLRRQTDRAKDLQILLLRRQLALVERKLDKPLRVSRAEKFTFALLTVQLKRTTGQTVKQLGDVIRTGASPGAHLGDLDSDTIAARRMTLAMDAYARSRGIEIADRLDLRRGATHYQCGDYGGVEQIASR